MKKSRVFLGAVLGGAALSVVGASGASAHAIIDVGDTDAVASAKGTMTLEIQHGCLTNEDGVIQVLAFVGKPWGRITPKPVQGWTSKIERAGSGQQVTWTKIDGDPQVFNDPVYFPMTVVWPAKAGVYGMTVTQVCPSDTTTWNTPPVPAVANAPSPPITPMPQVQVMAAGSENSSSSTEPSRVKANHPASGHGH